jgi:DNA-binding NarL/FixJ family response regulator
VAAGDAVIAPRVTRRLLERFAPHLPAGRTKPDVGTARQHPRLVGLTDRELDVLVLVARGLSNAEIADDLGVSPATVKSHVGSILAKLGLRDRVQAVVVAYETGLATA